MSLERAFMEGTLDPFEFGLAEALSMTVGDLRERMSSLEFQQWKAFIKYRNAMQEFQSKELSSGG